MIKKMINGIIIFGIGNLFSYAILHLVIYINILNQGYIRIYENNLGIVYYEFISVFIALISFSIILCRYYRGRVKNAILQI